MSDREKVIKELERLSEWFFHQYQVVYDGDAPNYYDAYKTVDEAIALLKEQEAVKPRFVDGNRNHFVKCGNCNLDLMHGMKFCPNCGKAVKWDDT